MQANAFKAVSLIPNTLFLINKTNFQDLLHTANFTGRTRLNKRRDNAKIL